MAESAVRTGHQAFIQRIRLEGREKEWHETIQKVREETGNHFLHCHHEAKKRMGYLGSKEEIRLAQERHIQNLEIQAGFRKKQMQEEIREEKKTQNFESAMAMLPKRAETKDELDWVAVHPAMTRLHRSKDKTKDIVIDADDILTTSAGRAPSQMAVNMLQHWVTNPNEFFKQVITEQKKSKDTDASKGVVKDKTISEIDAMLSTIE